MDELNMESPKAVIRHYMTTHKDFLSGEDVNKIQEIWTKIISDAPFDVIEELAGQGGQCCGGSQGSTNTLKNLHQFSEKYFSKNGP